MNPMYWRTSFFVVCIICVAGGFFTLGNRIFSNSQAIEKACILLDNKIVEQQRVQADPNSRTSILVGAIVRLMTKEEFEKFQRAPSMTLTRVTCDRDALEHIRATPVSTTPRRASGNP